MMMMTNLLLSIVIRISPGRSNDTRLERRQSLISRTKAPYGIQRISHDEANGCIQLSQAQPTPRDAT